MLATQDLAPYINQSIKLKGNKKGIACYSFFIAQFFWIASEALLFKPFFDGI